MVKIGDIRLNQASTLAIEVPVRDIVIHRDFSTFRTIENDIALALLEVPVNFSPYIQPVCIPESGFMVQAGTECWVTGWGKLKEKDPKEAAPDVLQEAELSIIRHEKCNELYKKKISVSTNVVKEGNVCGYNALGKDSCQVSSWASCRLCVLVVPSVSLLTGCGAFVTYQPLHSPFIQLRALMGQAAELWQAGPAQSCSSKELPLLEGPGRRGGSGRKCLIRVWTLPCDRRCLGRGFSHYYLRVCTFSLFIVNVFLKQFFFLY
uniref:Myosin light chain 3 n=1 Tax=Molossus molossus TaxID=27622 RepID=A0A7J8DC62_MOLMO|nr:myosin light chain 3 [Molossus molossus]